MWATGNWLPMRTTCVDCGPLLESGFCQIRPTTSPVSAARYPFLELSPARTQQEPAMSHLKRDNRLTDRERLFAKLARRIGRGHDAIFHGTRAPQEVLRSGKLKPDGIVGAISFTRSPEVAAYFALLLGYGIIRWSPAVLVLDRSSLVRNYRLDPCRYDEDWDDEQEEVCWGRTINFRRHLLGVVTESDVNKVLGPRKHTFYPRGYLNWSQAKRSTFFQSEFEGETLARAARTRVRDIIIRERKQLSMQNARSPAVPAAKTMLQPIKVPRVQRRYAHSKPTDSRKAKKVRKVKR
jgi:hypothetical protein